MHSGAHRADSGADSRADSGAHLGADSGAHLEVGSEASASEPVRMAMHTAAPAPSSGPREPEPAPEPSPTASKTGGDRGRTSPAGTRTVIEDEFLVEGKLEKPSAYYILRRSSLDYDWARLDAKFSPLVLESVQDPLF